MVVFAIQIFWFGNEFSPDGDIINSKTKDANVTDISDQKLLVKKVKP